MICKLLIDIYSSNINVFDKYEISEFYTKDYLLTIICKIIESVDDIIVYKECYYHMKNGKVLFEISDDGFNTLYMYLNNDYNYFVWIFEADDVELINYINNEFNLKIEYLDVIAERYINELISTDPKNPWLNNINIE